MLIRSFLLPGVAVPALCAAIALALAAWWGRRVPGTSLVGGSLAVGAAFVSAFVALSGWPRFPPVESTQRLFYWVAVVSLLALVWGSLKAAKPPWPLPAGAVAFLLWGMLRSPIEHRWSATEAALWSGGLLIVGLSVHWALARSLAVESGRDAVFAAGVRLTLLGGVALLLGLSGTARLAQLMGAVACGVLVVEVLAWRSGKPAWRPAAAMPWTVVVFGLLLGGYFFAEVEAWPAVLLIAGLLLLGLAGRAGQVWKFLPLLPLALAVAYVLVAFVQQEDDPYGEYYGSLGFGEPGISVDRGVHRVSGNSVDRIA